METSQKTRIMLTESNKNNNIKNKCPFPLLKRTNITDPLNYSHMMAHDSSFSFSTMKNMAKTTIMLTWYHRKTDFYLHRERLLLSSVLKLILTIPLGDAGRFKQLFCRK